MDVHTVILEELRHCRIMVAINKIFFFNFEEIFPSMETHRSNLRQCWESAGNDLVLERGKVHIWSFEVLYSHLGL